MENITDENYISLICNGEFNAIPGFPIGELFESFFDNINYNVVKKEDEVFVIFTGDATCDDEPCTITIKFKVDSSVTEFEIIEIKVDDDILDEEESLDLLEDIAYIGGAILEDGCDCGCEDCGEHHCHHDDCDCDHDDCDCNECDHCDCEHEDIENDEED